MKPRPIRMPDSLWDELTEEADEQNLGTAEYVRQILRRRDANTQPNTQADTQADTTALEERVAKVERELERLTSADTQPNTLPDTEPDTLSDTDVASDTVEEMEMTGRAHATKDARREVALEQLGWLRDRGSATAGDVRREFVDEDVLDRAEYSDDESYWEHFGRDVVFGQAEERGIVSINGGKYRWTG